MGRRVWAVVPMYCYQVPRRGLGTVGVFFFFFAAKKTKPVRWRPGWEGNSCFLLTHRAELLQSVDQSVQPLCLLFDVCVCVWIFFFFPPFKK